MEGQRLFLLSLMDEGMACQCAHLSLPNEREERVCDCHWLRAGLWPHASVPLLYTSVETDVCLSNVTKFTNT